MDSDMMNRGQEDPETAIAATSDPFADRCPLCGHEWRRHDPEDGCCDAHSNEGIGVCECGRDMAWMHGKIAALSRAALEAAADERIEAASAATSAGLHGKYYGLRRTRDGSLVEGFYFVLREDDPAAEAALLAYADACEGYAPELAADLRKHVKNEQIVRGLYEAGWER